MCHFFVARCSNSLVSLLIAWQPHSDVKITRLALLLEGTKEGCIQFVRGNRFKSLFFSAVRQIRVFTKEAELEQK